MSGRITQVYTEILALAKTIQRSNKDLFKYINVWDYQIDESIKGEGYNFKTPAFFAEIEMGEGVPIGSKFTSYPNCLIRFHLIDTLLNAAPNMEQNLAIFGIRDLVKLKFSTNGISFCSSLMCVEDKQDYKHDNTYKYVIGFKTNFIDSTGSIYDPATGNPRGTINNAEVEIQLINNNANG